MTSRPTCGQLLILLPSLNWWRPPRLQGLCSQRAHLWATSGSAPRFEVVGNPGGRGFVATRPTGGPCLILPPALKRWGAPKQQGLFRQPAHLRATSDSAPFSEVVDTS